MCGNQADKTAPNDWDECGQTHKENLRGAVWLVIDYVPKTEFCARELTSTISYQKERVKKVLTYNCRWASGARKKHIPTIS